MLEIIEQELTIISDKIGQLEQITKDLQENQETATRIAFTFPSKTISISSSSDTDYADIEAAFIEAIKKDIERLTPIREKLLKEVNKLRFERDKAEAEKRDAEERRAKERELMQREYELEKIRVHAEATEKARLEYENSKV